VTAVWESALQKSEYWNKDCQAAEKKPQFTWSEKSVCVGLNDPDRFNVSYFHISDTWAK
jgi:hypothetical protein